MSLRRIGKDFLVYGLGDFLAKLLGFVTMPVYTRVFSTADYGVWNYIMTLVGFLGGLLILGGDSAYVRFFFEAQTLEEKQRLTSTWFLFLFLWSVALVLVCLPFTAAFSHWSLGNGQHGALFGLALLAAPVSLFNTMAAQVLRNEFKSRLFTLLNLAGSLLTVGMSLGAVLLLHMGLSGVFGGALLAQLIQVPIRLYSIRGYLRPVFSPRLVKALLAYGVPLVPASIAYWVFMSSDRMVLGKLSTLEQVGLYSVANNLVNTLNLFFGALSQAWSPHAIRLHEEDPHQASIFCGRVLIYLVAIFGTLCVGLTVFSREVLVLLSTPRFYAAEAAIAPLALGVVAYATTQVTALGITLSKRTAYFAAFSWIAAVLNVGLNVVFVPRWGMLAASWSTAASFVFLTAAYLAVSQRFVPIEVAWGKLAAGVALTLVFTLGVPLLPSLDLWHDFMLKVFYMVAFASGLFVFQVLDAQDRAGLAALLRRGGAVAPV